MYWLERQFGTVLSSWALALALLLVAATASFALRQIHRRVQSSTSPHLRVLRVLDQAIYLPVQLLIWLYGPAISLLILLPEVPARMALVIVAHTLGAVLAIWLFLRLSRRMIAHLDRWSQRRSNALDKYFFPFLARCCAVLLPVFLLFSLLPLVTESPGLEAVLHNLASLVLIGGIAAVLMYMVGIGENILHARFNTDVADNLRARQVHTQVAMLRKLINFIIVVLAIASMLMVFDKVRQLGASILASAGIIGVVVGFAAQKVLGNLLAGIQIALTQPIRLDDAVVVEGEWGRVEELTLTYVVIRIWDLRRLVLPINYFIDNPFQNWTRSSADLIGTVFFYVDYTLPLDPVREELARILAASTYWDGKVSVVQATDFSERTMQVRILVSAGNGGDAFDLRCEVREKLIAFINAHYPYALPRLRAETGELAPQPDRNSTSDDVARRLGEKA
ncbi:mechanosensitive ion channel family protein [Halomonas sp. McH1-25]|uniref:mechanosensitive ion channel family protein n=1 Tax=unclassified Halomonas TaxID=2609666 RepID=UPI001EF66C8A|nr:MULTISPECIES: mechanosensitive ion channel domain-containing protein [unclassified Halomonas]MCG7598675.1 mechanosensitive ion channel family protein [Halomonas sp. McH1-25]MCP1340638.1 mechanosensitive ion channel family protein [Halomonas sp. FL8]MCP1359409.1 mechanosensitive ion channel family protein [Halomonas sp. BBD45]